MPPAPIIVKKNNDNVINLVSWESQAKLKYINSETVPAICKGWSRFGLLLIIRICTQSVFQKHRNVIPQISSQILGKNFSNQFVYRIVINALFIRERLCLGYLVSTLAAFN